jgi:hypothetical protein
MSFKCRLKQKREFCYKSLESSRYCFKIPLYAPYLFLLESAEDENYYLHSDVKNNEKDRRIKKSGQQVVYIGDP